jgi:hypothetical protein
MKHIIHPCNIRRHPSIRRGFCFVFPPAGQVWYWRAKPCLAMAAGGFEGMSVFREASSEDSSYPWKVPKIRDSRGKSLVLEGARNQ